MASWIDTRPGRPAGRYMVGGVEFEAGKAETGNLTAGCRALFAALGIVPEQDAPAAAPEVDETGLPEGAVVLDEVVPAEVEHIEGDTDGEPVEVVGEKLTDAQAAEVEASGVELPVLDEAPAPARRTRGAK